MRKQTLPSINGSGKMFAYKECAIGMKIRQEYLSGRSSDKYGHNVEIFFSLQCFEMRCGC